jgi:hypothetical protein
VISGELTICLLKSTLFASPITSETATLEIVTRFDYFRSFARLRSPPTESDFAPDKRPLGMLLHSL